MTLTWTEKRGIYLVDGACYTHGLLANTHPAWKPDNCSSKHFKTSLDTFNRRYGTIYEITLLTTDSKGKITMPKLEFDLYQLTYMLKMCWNTVKSTGIICLVGIGLGFGLTTWIIYKIYHRTKQKFGKDDTESAGDSMRHHNGLQHELDEGLNSLVMGNNSSLDISAGFSVEAMGQDTDVSGIRHRHNTKYRDSAVCASIVEKESGAYIARTAFQTTSITASDKRDQENCSKKDTISMDVVEGAIDGSHTLSSRGHTDQSNISDHSLGNITETPVMNDSGYLDIDTGSNIIFTHQKPFDGCASITSTSPSDEDALLVGVHQRGTSEISSLSDQQMRDLGADDTFSEISSRCGSSILNGDEDVICIELEDSIDDTLSADHLTYDETLCGSVLHDDEITTHSMTSTNTTLTSDSPRDSLHSQHILLSSNDRDSLVNYYASDDQSNRSNSSPLSQFRLDNESSRPSSVFSSPLFGAVTTRSRSSSTSMTSADVDLEAAVLGEIETDNNIEIMEQELEEIKLEIEQVEEKLEELMAVETSNLYFNVDGMKKLTDVVMNSDDINLTQSEIAKAFQILRKYRYAMTTPERKPMPRHNDAESISWETPSSKSLPYLDLADSCVSESRKQSVTDWVDGFTTVHGLGACDPHSGSLTPTKLVLVEQDIAEYTDHHPLYAKGYTKLSENYGYSRMCLINMHCDAVIMAAYAALIIQDSSDGIHADSINIDRSLKVMSELLTTPSSYLHTWDFSHISISTDVLSMMKLCLKTVYDQFIRLRSLEDQDERICGISDLLNHTTNCQSLISEGLRILTYLRVHELYDKYTSGHEIPLHGWLLFSDDSSHSPRYYFLNHIQSRGREPSQVDLCLLADVLGTRLEIFRPLESNGENFHRMYPEDKSNTICIPIAYQSNSKCAVLL